MHIFKINNLHKVLGVDNVFGFGNLKGDKCKNAENIEFKPYINFVWANQINNFDVNNYNNLIKSKSNIDENGCNEILSYNGYIRDIMYLYEYGVRAIEMKGKFEVTKGTISNINNLGILMDCNGLEDKDFDNLRKYTATPFFSTIGNSFDVCSNANNLKIERLKAIRDAQGVVGVNIEDKYLTSHVGRYDSFEYMFKHIDYLIETVGEDCIGFSCGFNQGLILPWEVQKCKDMQIVYHWLEEYYGREVCEKLMFKNVLRLIENVLK